LEERLAKTAASYHADTTRIAPGRAALCSPKCCSGAGCRLFSRLFAPWLNDFETPMSGLSAFRPAVRSSATLGFG